MNNLYIDNLKVDVLENAIERRASDKYHLGQCTERLLYLSQSIGYKPDFKPKSVEELLGAHISMFGSNTNFNDESIYFNISALNIIFCDIKNVDFNTFQSGKSVVDYLMKVEFFLSSFLKLPLEKCDVMVYNLYMLECKKAQIQHPNDTQYHPFSWCFEVLNNENLVNLFLKCTKSVVFGC